MGLQSLIPSWTPANLHFVRRAVCTSLVISAARWHSLFTSCLDGSQIPNSSQTKTEGPWRLPSHHGLPCSNSHQTQGRGTFLPPQLCPFQISLHAAPCQCRALCFCLHRSFPAEVHLHQLGRKAPLETKKKGLVTTARHTA